MDFIILLLIPFAFIGVFISAPFWVSLITKSEHKEVLKAASKYTGKEREEFLQSKREENRKLDNLSSIAMGVFLIVASIFGMLTGDFSMNKYHNTFSRGDWPEAYDSIMGIVFVLGLVVLVYGIFWKLKDKKLNK